MRVSLFGFNVLALGVLAAPSLLICQSALSAVPAGAVERLVYPASLCAGMACLLLAMMRLTGRRYDPPSAVPLMLIGAVLFAGPLTLLLTR